MADELRADLELSTADAERAVEDLRSSIEDALKAAAGSFEEEFARITGALDPIEVEADASAVAPAIDTAIGEADTTVAVEPEGAEQLTFQIEDAVQSADATVQIEGDTSDLVSAIDDVGDSASGAVGPVNNLVSGVGASGLQGVSSAATGSVAGLGGAITGMDASAAGAVGAVGAVGATVAVMFNNAVEAEGSVFRLKNTMGDLSGQIDHLKVGNLNADLSKLALTVGSDDDHMRDAAASAFTMATSFGKGREESATFTAGLLAIATRATALNPALGDAGDAASTLLRALQSGRERALIPFQLGLSKTEIDAKALQLAMEDGRSEINASDRAFAGISLSVAKFGGHLQEDIAKGAENPINKLKSLKQTVLENLEALGKPLVTPIFDIMEKAIPIADDLGRIIAVLAKGALPALSSSLKIIEPVLSIVATILEHLPAPLVTAAVTTLLFSRSMSTANDSTISWGRALTGIVFAIGLAIDAFKTMDGTTKGTAMGIGEMALAGAQLGAMIGGPQGLAIGGAVGAAVGGITALGKSLFGAGENADDFKKRIKGVSDEIDQLGTKGATVAFLRQVKGLFTQEWGKEPQINVAALRKELVELGRVDPTGARRVLEGITAQAAALGLTERQVRSLTNSVSLATVTYGQHLANQAAVASGNQEIAAQATAAAKAIEDEKQRHEDYVSSLTDGLPTILDVFDKATEGVEGWGEAGVQSSEELLAAFQKQLEGINNWATNLQILTDRGMYNLVGVFARRGPEASGALLQGLIDGDPAIVGQLESTVAQGDATLRTLADRIGGPIAELLYQKLYGAGQQAMQGFGDGIAIKAWYPASQASTAAQNVYDQAATILYVSSPSKLFDELGHAVTDGFAGGIEDGTHDVVRAAEAMTRAAAMNAAPADMPTPAGGGAFSEDAIARALASVLPNMGVTVVRVDTVEQAAEYIPAGAPRDDFLWGRK